MADYLKKYNTVIFDLDGTLLDTLEDLKDAVNHTMKLFGFRERTLEEVRTFVGNGVNKLIEKCLPEGMNTPGIEDIISEYRQFYSSHAEIKTKPYDGIEELLVKLSEEGIKTAVVSNKLHKAVEILCDTYFSRVSYACGERESEGIRRKPNPDMVLDAMDVLSADPDSTIYVSCQRSYSMCFGNMGIQNEKRTCGSRSNYDGGHTRSSVRYHFGNRDRKGGSGIRWYFQAFYSYISFWRFCLSHIS